MTPLDIPTLLTQAGFLAYQGLVACAVITA